MFFSLLDKQLTYIYLSIFDGNIVFFYVDSMNILFLEDFQIIFGFFCYFKCLIVIMQ
jgi:hypothetical protein